MNHQGPGKCRLHNKDLIWVLKEWFCPDCETDDDRTIEIDLSDLDDIGMDGPDGFRIIGNDGKGRKGGI